MLVAHVYCPACHTLRHRQNPSIVAVLVNDVGSRIKQHRDPAKEKQRLVDTSSPL